MKEYLNLFKDKTLPRRYGIMALSLFISAINYNLLILPLNLVTGGSGGIAVITKHLFNIDPSIMVFIICFICLLLCAIFLDAENTVGALFVTIFFPIFIKITAGVSDFVFVDTSNVILICFYSAIINGVTNAMIYKEGLNAGGTGVIAKILYKYKHISQNEGNGITNAIIVLVGAYCFGINMLLYAAIFIFITAVSGEMSQLGVSQNKIIYTVTTKYNKIAETLKELNHDSTMYEVETTHKNRDDKMIMTVVPTREYYLIKNIIRKIDKKSFIFVTDSYQTSGQDVSIKNV